MAWKNRAARSAGIHNEMVQSAYAELGHWQKDNKAIGELLGKFDEVDGVLMDAEDYFKGY